ncbi:unnamed protein product [Agarophyton chilense]
MRTRHYWLLLSAAYGILNAGAKWKEITDTFLRDIGVLLLEYVPQLFYRRFSRERLTLAVELVDDILFAAPRHRLTQVINRVKDDYMLGTVVYGSHSEKEFCNTIHGDHKLQCFELLVISRLRRKEPEDTLKNNEKARFGSLNSSIGWLGIAASQCRAHAASFIQQKKPLPYVKDLVTQVYVLRGLKKRGTTVSYCKPLRLK